MQRQKTEGKRKMDKKSQELRNVMKIPHGAVLSKQKFFSIHQKYTALQKFSFRRVERTHVNVAVAFLTFKQRTHSYTKNQGNRRG